MLGTRQSLGNYLMGSSESGLGSAIPSAHPHGDYVTDLGPTGLGRGVHLAGGFSAAFNYLHLTAPAFSFPRLGEVCVEARKKKTHFAFHLRRSLELENRELGASIFGF